MRFTSEQGEKRFVSDRFTIAVERMAQDLAGSSGSLVTTWLNAFAAGGREHEGLTKFERGINGVKAAFEATGARLAEQSRLFTQVMRPKMWDDVSEDVTTKVKSLKLLAANARILLGAGKFTSLNGDPISSNTLLQSTTDHPVWQTVQISANNMLKILKGNTDDIRRLRAERAALGNATRWQGEAISPTRRNQLIDAHVLKIKDLQGQQLVKLKMMEEEMENTFSDHFPDMKFTIDLSDIPSNAKLGEGPILQAPNPPPLVAPGFAAPDTGS